MTIDDHIPNTAKPTKTHPDDVAVDNFAVAMKEKLAIARGRGRSGWGKCDPAHLSAMLYEHVQKGDPRDVANFCMFLWNLGQPITPCKPTQAEPVAYFCEWDGWTQYHDERDPLPDKWDDAPKKITPLYTHPAPAVAVNEQDQIDAARYRYLRDDGDGFDISVREEGDEGEEWVTGYPPDELNAAIDAAIAAAEATKGGV